MEDVPVAPRKPMGIKTYLLLITVGIMVLAFLADLVMSMKAGTGVNLDLVNKLLDTLLVLLSSPDAV